MWFWVSVFVFGYLLSSMMYGDIWEFSIIESFFGYD